MPALPKGSFNRVAHVAGKGIDAPVDDNKRTLLHIAAEHGDQAAVARLLRLGAKAGQMDAQGRPPLFEAILRRDVETVRLLVEAGASFAVEDDEGMTPLLLAVQTGGGPAFLEALRDLGLDLRHTNDAGVGALHAAALADDNEMMGYLLENGLFVDVPDGKGETALFKAAQKGAVGALTFLLGQGADPLLRSREIKTPLHAAAAAGHEDVVDALLAIPGVRYALNDFQTYAEGWTPLMEAVVFNHPGVVEKLLDLGADPNQRDIKNRHSLFIAAERGYVDVARLLIAHGADVVKAPRHADNNQSLLQSINVLHYDEMLFTLVRAGANVDELDALGETALFKAAAAKNAPKVRALLELGADPNIATANGRRPIDAAVVSYSSGDYYERGTTPAQAAYDTVDALLAHNASPQMAPGNAQSYAPLHAAARAGNVQLVQLLLRAGANIEEPDHVTGLTPVLTAVGARSTEVAELLLKAGADITKKDKNNRGLLHTAAASGMRAYIDLALKSAQLRADINRRDALGTPPLHLALHSTRTDCIAPLVAAGADVSLADAAGLKPVHIVSSAYSDLLFNALDRAAGAKLDWNAQTEIEKETPMHLAARNGHKNIIDNLLQKNVDITLRDAKGQTPLMAAVYADQIVAVMALVDWCRKKGIALDAQRDAAGRTPLHVAAMRWTPRVLQVLLDGGADINAATADGMTPLHLAARFGRAEIVRLLIEKGADPSVRNKSGATPIDIAGDRKDIIDVLKDAARQQEAKKNPPRGIVGPKRPPSGP